MGVDRDADAVIPCDVVRAPEAVSVVLDVDFKRSRLRVLRNGDEDIRGIVARAYLERIVVESVVFTPGRKYLKDLRRSGVKTGELSRPELVEIVGFRNSDRDLFKIEDDSSGEYHLAVRGEIESFYIHCLYRQHPASGDGTAGKGDDDLTRGSVFGAYFSFSVVKRVIPHEFRCSDETAVAEQRDTERDVFSDAVGERGLVRLAEEFDVALDVFDIRQGERAVFFVSRRRGKRFSCGQDAVEDDRRLVGCELSGDGERQHAVLFGQPVSKTRERRVLNDFDFRTVGSFRNGDGNARLCAEHADVFTPLLISHKITVKREEIDLFPADRRGRIVFVERSYKACRHRSGLRSRRGRLGVCAPLRIAAQQTDPSHLFERIRCPRFDLFAVEESARRLFFIG